MSMKFPRLVPDAVCHTPIKLSIEVEGITEDGAPTELIEYEGMCNFQDGGSVVYTADQKEVYISGRAYFNGDILPEIPNIVSGTAEIFGAKREIFKGFKRRNLDGTVNHTEVQFK